MCDDAAVSPRAEIDEERTMKKVILLMALAVLGAGQAAAQPAAMREEIRAACMSDYRRFCFGVIPGGGRIIN
jgi:hypothetical protein